MAIDGEERVRSGEVQKRLHLRGQSTDPQHPLLVIQDAVDVDNQPEAGAVDVIHSREIKHHSLNAFGDCRLNLRVGDLQRGPESKRPLEGDDRSVIGQTLDICRQRHA